MPQTHFVTSALFFATLCPGCDDASSPGRPADAGVDSPARPDSGKVVDASRDGTLPEASVCSTDTSACSEASKPSCSDFCGSDFIALPLCCGGQWACPPDFVDVTGCPPTCGLPGYCCADDGGALIEDLCVDGGHVCPPGSKVCGS